MKIKRFENDGVVKTVKAINQSSLTDECWLVQIFGKGKCLSCKDKDRNCGGKKIRRTGKNKKGISVPLTDEDNWMQVVENKC